MVLIDQVGGLDIIRSLRCLELLFLGVVYKGAIVDVAMNMGNQGEEIQDLKPQLKHLFLDSE